MTIWRKRFLVYQRNACKSIIDDRGRAGLGENDLCQKKKNPLQNTTCASRLSAQVKKIKPFAEHDLRVTLECAGNNRLIPDYYRGVYLSVDTSRKNMTVFDMKHGMFGPQHLKIGRSSRKFLQPQL